MLQLLQDVDAFFAGEHVGGVLGASLGLDFHAVEVHSGQPALVEGEQLHELLYHHAAVLVSQVLVQRHYLLTGDLLVDKAHHVHEVPLFQLGPHLL